MIFLISLLERFDFGNVGLFRVSMPTSFTFPHVVSGNFEAFCIVSACACNEPNYLIPNVSAKDFLRIGGGIRMAGADADSPEARHFYSYRLSLFGPDILLLCVRSQRKRIQEVSQQ